MQLLNALHSIEPTLTVSRARSEDFTPMGCGCELAVPTREAQQFSNAG